MKVKNYKELCKLLGIEPKTSNSKKKQLREINELIKYRKSGNSFIIEKIYNKKVVKAQSVKPRDKRYKNPKNIYTRYINQILLQILNDSPEKKLSNIDFKDICVLLNLAEVDDNEKYVFKDIDGTVLEMTQEQRTFSIQKMVSIIKSGLKSMVNKGYVTYSHNEREYTVYLSSSINVINLPEEEFQREKQMLHEEFIAFIKSNYLKKKGENR